MRNVCIEHLSCCYMRFEFLTFKHFKIFCWFIALPFLHSFWFADSCFIDCKIRWLLLVSFFRQLIHGVLLLYIFFFYMIFSTNLLFIMKIWTVLIGLYPSSILGNVWYLYLLGRPFHLMRLVFPSKDENVVILLAMSFMVIFISFFQNNLLVNISLYFLDHFFEISTIFVYLIWKLFYLLYTRLCIFFIVSLSNYSINFNIIYI